MGCPFRRPEDITKTDEAVLKEFPNDEAFGKMDPDGEGEGEVSGIAARICWLGYGQRARMGKVFNDMVARGE